MNGEPLIYFFGNGGCEGDPHAKEVLGGKGASLARMSRAGLPVPPGFTLSVDCCAYYHEHGGAWPEGLEDELRRNLRRLEEVTVRTFGQGRKPLLVSVRSGAAVSMPGMMDTLLNCGLHPGLAADMADSSRFWIAYAQFVRQFGRTVADIAEDAFDAAAKAPGGAKVAGEDLARAYIGLYETSTGKCFPVDPWRALVECVNAVFDSWNNERAILYRRAQDLRGLRGTAVTVQAMFPSEVSGIAFTANPADPSAEVVVIESSYGLGEAIVSGMVSPDLFIVDRASLRVANRTLGRKDAAVTSLEGAAEALHFNPEAFSLTDEQVAQVARLALDAERCFGFPVDTEWGLHDGRLVLLQARGIAGLEVARDMEIGRREEIERLKALAGTGRKVWVAHNMGETLPTPTPLTWDILRAFMSGDGGFGRMYKDLGYKPSAQVCKEGFLELICGRVYADPERAAGLFWPNMPLEYDPDELRKDPRLIETAPANFNAHRADSTFFIRLPGMVAAMLRCWRTMKRLRAAALGHFLQDILPPYQAYVSEKHKQDLTALPTAAVLAELRERIARVLDGFASESLRLGFFGGLARAELERALTRLMGEAEARRACSLLTSGLPGDSTVEQNRMLYHVANDGTKFGDFLDRYGHRAVGEMELAEPRWREDSSYLRTVVATCRKHSSPTPEELHAANEERRQAAECELPDLLARWGGSSMQREIESRMKEAQTLLPYREIGKHYWMMGYELIRLALVELARRWDLGRDVFFLRLDELERFEGERDALQKQIARRKIRWQSAKRLLPGDVVDSADLENLGLAPHVDSAEKLEGLPLAPGLAEGDVRIVFSPDEAGVLPDECVLVCPSTDPGWAAMFLNIRGLVVEQGGVLSHGAIAARDFGIPAVACRGATQLLHGARRVRVDGGAGRVVVLEGDRP